MILKWKKGSNISSSPKLVRTYPHLVENRGISMAPLFLWFITWKILHQSIEIFVKLDFFTNGLVVWFIFVYAKIGFVSERAMCFFHCQNEYSKSLSWTWNLNFPPITVNNLFKFQAQDSDLEYLFGQCEKHITLSGKKSHL